MINIPADSEVDIRYLEAILDYSNFTNSYKLFWLNGIFKEVVRGNKNITFKRIACRMISTAWYPLIQYKLNLGLQDQLYDIVKIIKLKYDIQEDVEEEIILEYIYGLNDKEIDDFVSRLCRYVPYRLLTPFYNEILRGKKDGVKNQIIQEAALSYNNSLYRINLNGSVTINDSWFKYIQQNQVIIKGWIEYKLIYFLQKKNPNVPAIPFKLYPNKKRELTQAKKFWDIVNNDNTLTDIYTSKLLNEDNFDRYGSMSIDHFIPWSFILHDELWNLVPTFRNINSSKSNLLPDSDLYLNKFCEIHYYAFNKIRHEEKMRNYLEDYLNINIPLILNPLDKKYNYINKEVFCNKLKDTVSPLYQIAYNQGYRIWKNDK